MGWFASSDERRERREARREAHKFDAIFEGLIIDGDVVKFGGWRWPVAEVQAAVETGAQLQRMSAGRVAAGAVLAGPVGALLGGMAKKDATKVYVALQTPDGPRMVDGPIAHEAAARRWVMQLERAHAAMGVTASA